MDHLKKLSHNKLVYGMPKMTINVTCVKWVNKFEILENQKVSFQP